MTRKFLPLITILLVTALAFPEAMASAVRSESAKNAFKASHPCPSTGARHGACRGYVIDHVNPLACGGADAPSNMQWQSDTAGKAKDKWERAGCQGHHSTPSTTSSSGAGGSHEIMTGPRGGKYYINSHGNKTYIKR